MDAILLIIFSADFARMPHAAAKASRTSTQAGNSLHAKHRKGLVHLIHTHGFFALLKFANKAKTESRTGKIATHDANFIPDRVYFSEFSRINTLSGIICAVISSFYILRAILGATLLLLPISTYRSFDIQG